MLLAIADEVDLDIPQFVRTFDSGVTRAKVLEVCRMGQEQYHVRGTPTLMLADGTRLRPPIAFQAMWERKIVAVGKLPCCGEGCLDTTRALIERALQSRG